MDSFGEQQEEMPRTYINIMYEDKDKVKKAGAKWDLIKKSWYIYEDYSLFLLRTGIKLKGPKTYFKVDYEDKDIVKKLGAKYDIVAKSWYTFEELDDFLNKFSLEKEIDELEQEVKGLQLSLKLNRNVDMTASNKIYEDGLNRKIKELEELIRDKRKQN